MKYCLQEDNFSCGKAVTRTILAYVNKNNRYLYLPLRLEQCNDFYSIKQVAEQNGLILEGYKVEDNQLILKEKYPLIVRTKDNGVAHFIILLRVYRKKVKIFDPAVGLIYKNMDDFNECNTGEYLSIKEFKKNNIVINKLLKNKENSFLTIFSLITILPLILLLYFANENNITLTYFLLFCCLLFGFIKKWYTFIISRRIDERAIIPVLQKKQKKLLYPFAIDLKGKVLNNSDNFLISIITLLISLLIILSNDFSLMYIVLIITSVEFIYQYAFKGQRQKLSMEITKKEKYMLETNKNDCDIVYKDVTKLSYKFYFFILTKYLIQTIVITSFLVFIMAKRQYSVNYLLFYGMYLMFYLNTLKKIIEAKDNYYQIQKLFNKINQY